METVFEHEGSDAAICKGLRNFPAFVTHRQPPEATTGRYDNGRAIRLARFRQEWSKSRSGNVPRHRISPLAEPSLRRRLVFHTASAEQNSVRFSRSFERVDGAILCHGKCREYK